MDEKVHNPTMKSKKREGDKYPNAISALKANAKRVGEIKKEQKKRTTSDGHMVSGSFTKRLEAHKAEAASLDSGKWKPKKKGQTFIQALEEHKSKHEFD